MSSARWWTVWPPAESFPGYLLVRGRHERDALARAARRLYGRFATWEPDDRIPQCVFGSERQSFFGAVWRSTSIGGEARVTECCRWDIQRGIQ